jgi:hypothetical protein
MHEPPAATADLAALLSELQALRAGSRASAGLEPCDALRSTSQVQAPLVARSMTISTISPRRAVQMRINYIWPTSCSQGRFPFCSWWRHSIVPSIPVYTAVAREDLAGGLFCPAPRCVRGRASSGFRGRSHLQVSRRLAHREGGPHAERAPDDGEQGPRGIYFGNAWAWTYEQQEEEGRRPRCGACGGFSWRALQPARRGERRTSWKGREPWRRRNDTRCARPVRTVPAGRFPI